MTENTNPWTTVKPLSPTEATLELSFVFLDITNGESDPEVFTQRLVDMLNGVYLKGWQDAREVIVKNAAELIADIYASVQE